jgi:hypothetical protein
VKRRVGSLIAWNYNSGTITNDQSQINPGFDTSGRGAGYNNKIERKERKKMKKFAIVSLLAIALLGMAGCGKEKENNATVAKPVLRGTAVPGTRSRERGAASSLSLSPRLLQPTQSVAPSAAASPPPHKTEMMERMGIEVGSGTIRIDTRKARSFFEAMERQISGGVNRGVQKAKQHQNRSGVEDIGIHVEKDRIEIDLNKTKRFMKIWGESMKILGEEIEKSLQPPR